MSLFNNKPTPARLHKKVSWREKYEVEIIFAKGILLIIYYSFLHSVLWDRWIPTLMGV